MAWWIFWRSKTIGRCVPFCTGISRRVPLRERGLSAAVQRELWLPQRTGLSHCGGHHHTVRHGARPNRVFGALRLDEADIVVTNPPFSLFREYVATLMEHDKKFIIIGNVNAITYKEFFPLLKDNKVWIGASIHSGDRKFYVPDDYPLNAAGCGIDEDGRRFIRVKGIRWYTNLDIKQRHEEMILVQRYTPEKYAHFDNYDAINIDATADIPCDYEGVMGCRLHLWINTALINLKSLALVLQILV